MWPRDVAVGVLLYQGRGRVEGDAVCGPVSSVVVVLKPRWIWRCRPFEVCDV